MHVTAHALRRFADRVMGLEPALGGLTDRDLFWLYAVDASGVTPGLAVLLKLPAIRLLAYATWMQARSMWLSWRASSAKPSMTAWEREGFDDDLAFAAKWIASGHPTMRQRGENKKFWVAEKVARRA